MGTKRAHSNHKHKYPKRAPKISYEEEKVEHTGKMYLYGILIIVLVFAAVIIAR